MSFPLLPPDPRAMLVWPFLLIGLAGDAAGATVPTETSKGWSCRAIASPCNSRRLLMVDSYVRMLVSVSAITSDVAGS
jgi:hypothetical protein